MPVIPPPTNFSGLSSGIDTNSLVERLMQLERLPQQRLDDKIARVQQRKSAWMNVNGALLTLKTSADALKDASLWSKLSASVSDPASATATAGAGAAAGSYNMTVSFLARAESNISASFESASDDLGLAGTFDITVAGKTKSITLGTTDSLNKVRDRINEAGTGVTASVVSTTSGSYSLLVQSNSTGTANAISYSDDATNHTLQNLGLLTGGGAKNLVQTARDAEFSLNGLTFTRASNTVSDVLTGVTLTLKGENTTGFSLTVQADTAAMYGGVQDLVNRFNSAQATVRKAIERGGVLQGDPGLNDIASEMASLSYSNVPGLTAVENLSRVGVTLQRDGSLSLDSAKLTAALTDSLSDVKAMFSTASTGVASRFSAYLDGLTSLTGTINGLSRSFDTQVQELQRQRQAMEVVLTVRQQTLKAQFLRMEEAVGRLQAQGNWLTAQIRGLNGGNSDG